MKDNETIAEIRRIRREMSRKVDFDKERQKPRTAKRATRPDR